MKENMNKSLLINDYTERQGKDFKNSLLLLILERERKGEIRNGDGGRERERER